MVLALSPGYWTKVEIESFRRRALPRKWGMGWGDVSWEKETFSSFGVRKNTFSWVSSKGTLCGRDDGGNSYCLANVL